MIPIFWLMYEITERLRQRPRASDEQSTNDTRRQFPTTETADNWTQNSDDGNGLTADRKREQAQHVIQSVRTQSALQVYDANSHNYQPTAAADEDDVNQTTARDDYEENQRAVEANDHHRLSEEAPSWSSSDHRFEDSSEDELSQRFRLLRTDDEVSIRDSPDQGLMRRLQALRTTDDNVSPRTFLDQGNPSKETLRQGLRERFYLFAYEGNCKDTNVFLADCLELAKALGLQTGKEQSPNLFLIPRDEIEEQVFGLTSLRQKQIADSLLNGLKTKFPLWIINKEEDLTRRIREIWLRISLLQAKNEVVKYWTPNVKNIFQENLDADPSGVLQMILHVWPKMCNSSSRTTQLLDIEFPFKLAKYIDDRWKDISKWKIVKAFASNNPQNDLLKFTCEILRKSFYCAGTPSIEEMEDISLSDLEFLLECTPYFQTTIIPMPGDHSWRRKKTRTEKAFTKNFDENITKSITRQSKNFPQGIVIFFEVLDCLANISKMHAPYQWIWIHISCHSAKRGFLNPQEPFPQTQDTLELLSDLFTSVVFSVDCCFPKVSGNLGSTNLCVISPNDGKHKTTFERATKLSDFTQLLIHAVKGFDYSKCDSTVASYYDKNQPCHCPGCKNYSSQLKVSYTKNKYGAVKCCEYCRYLRETCRQNGFLYPKNIQKFFKHHKCNAKPSPIIYFHEEVFSAPLVECKLLDQDHVYEVV